MKIKINTAKTLVNLLFFLIALLFGAIGLKLGINALFITYSLQIGIIFGVISFSILLFGAIYPFIIKLKKENPSKIRLNLMDRFNYAEKNPKKFLIRLKVKNALFSSYYVLISVVGLTFFTCVSICLFVEYATWLLFPLIFIATVPLRKLIEYFIKKDNFENQSSGIIKEEFPTTFNFFEEIVKREFGSKYSLKLDFGSINTLNATLVGKIVVINLNSYAFMLFNEGELKSLAIRELRALKDAQCKKIVKVLKSRSVYLSNSLSNKLFSAYFSFVISDTVTNFDFSKNALKRYLEKSKDTLIRKGEYAEPYLTAYKKQCVLDCYFSDARSFITLKICQDELSLRDFVPTVYNIFCELIPVYGNEWEKEVEQKLKPIVSDKLNYSEKSKFFGFTVKCGKFYNHCTDEQKTLYDKYGAEYYESTKRANEPKKRAIEGYYREIERYEQFPKEYDERLKLITVAHAYYMTAQLDKAEEVYKGIISSGDTTSETYFDYGCFLLLAKKDKQGVEYIYKAMDNENLVEEGFEVLGRYFVNSGDEEGYKKFCEYKAKRLDEIVDGFQGRMLDKNADFEKTTLDEKLLNEIVDKLSKDDNLDEIYCADSKTKSGGKIIVFAVSVSNKNQEALINTYERVFSILDNDYGKYDTFLISLDADPDKKLVNRIKNNKNHLIFKK